MTGAAAAPVAEDGDKTMSKFEMKMKEQAFEDVCVSRDRPEAAGDIPNGCSRALFLLIAATASPHLARLTDATLRLDAMVQLQPGRAPFRASCASCHNRLCNAGIGSAGHRPAARLGGRKPREVCAGVRLAPCVSPPASWARQCLLPLPRPVAPLIRWTR